MHTPTLNPSKCFYALGLLLLLVVSLPLKPLAAEDMVLVKDINTNPRALNIFKRCVAGSNEFLFASDGTRGYELWLGDGLQGTTRLVKDIYVGSDSGVLSGVCAALGNTLLFVGTDATNGNELWKSDGTSAGTVLVKNILSGVSGSSISNIAILGNIAIFQANDGVNGNELWSTDGTTEGTVLLKDIFSGASSSNPGSLTKFDDSTIFFQARTSAAGTELWKTDGTSTGTVLVKDIAAGASNSTPQNLTKIGTKLFFSATTASTGREPWISDGTESGTFILADLFTGAADGFGSLFSELGIVNGKVVFSARNTTSGYELFVSDGTVLGTSLLKDIQVGASGSFPNYFFNLGALTLFSATTTSSGTEIYKTDGSSDGTVLMADLNPGTSSGVYLETAATTVAGTPLLFSGGITAGGTPRMYATDGSAIDLITDLFPGATGVSIDAYSPPTSSGLTFGLPAPVDSIPPPGRLLTAGTAVGTIVHPGTLLGFTESSAVIPMVELSGKLLFAADNGTHGMELWTSDGSETGTQRLTDINPGIASSVMPQAGFAVLNNKLLFVAADAEHGAELWISDGTTSGTVLLKDIEPGVGSAFTPSGYARKFFVLDKDGVADDRVVFPASTTAFGTELWMSDGSTSGTSLVSDIRSGTQSSISEELDAAVSSSVLGPTLFFKADNGTSGDELWATTTVVTGITADLLPGAGSSGVNEITAIPASSGGFFGVVYRACPAASGCEVFISIGGAPAVIDIVPGATGSNPSDFTFVSDSRMFFRASTAAQGTELWKSDTPFTTASIVKDVVAGAGNFEIAALAKLNSSTILFRGCGDGGGLNCELWKSDGSNAGTTLVKDLRPGAASSGPEGITVLNNVAYFLAFDGVTNFNGSFFRSDGTEAGTSALTSQGVEYYSVSTLPAPFTPAVGSLFFGAFSSSYGYELFKIGDDQCPSDSNKSVPGLCGCGVAETDADGDGAVDCLEACPSDPLKSGAGACGCGALETDSDGDGTANCVDACPSDSGKALAGSCGCGIPETDDDKDGVANCVDSCSADSQKSSPGTCGCGTPDSDSNANGQVDCVDALVAGLTPKSPKLKIKKKKLNITMTSQAGVSYKVLYRTQKKASKLSKKAKFKSKISKTTILSLAAPKKGFVTYVKYQYSVPGTSILSKESKVIKKAGK